MIKKIIAVCSVAFVFSGCPDISKIFSNPRLDNEGVESKVADNTKQSSTESNKTDSKTTESSQKGKSLADVENEKKAQEKAKDEHFEKLYKELEGSKYKVMPVEVSRGAFLGDSSFSLVGAVYELPSDTPQKQKDWIMKMLYFLDLTMNVADKRLQKLYGHFVPKGSNCYYYIVGDVGGWIDKTFQNRYDECIFELADDRKDDKDFQVWARANKLYDYLSNMPLHPKYQGNPEYTLEKLNKIKNAGKK
ncbi:hypothetical protein DCO58_00300 [Helicobacter saguini]|uniref:Lipoprotein n=1 Tax=Helicobacter saguini TaxID=1548018 RepID=A0A347VQT4_9HELI|nr:hypothetical protein [Helicobacter saguini]MWV63166.1 hypothetical protein [Helicobacter saguini]MWV66164.1 hypothetical protein [Helicobacter saguini]MWV68513.1 hypothetical protein [Helicobacter saguini]MWV71932.1 hypothetical protein [Helicobacter saguini]TLD95944.1 hypothetical protein LS64_000855 [Helicobacter saguini]